jgi:hypothetical protein
LVGYLLCTEERLFGTEERGGVDEADARICRCVCDEYWIINCQSYTGLISARLLRALRMSPPMVLAVAEQASARRWRGAVGMGSVQAHMRGSQH